jgi:hypothetical protein
VWTAGAGTTEWTTPGNWDKNVSPVPEDSATIPVLGSAIYPVFTAPQTIGRIVVADGANVNVAGFSLEVDGDALAGLSGGIVSSIAGGIIILNGDATLPGEMQGVLPRTRVTRSYTLTGNVNATAPVRVESGRIRSTGFRLRVQSQ